MNTVTGSLEAILLATALLAGSGRAAEVRPEAEPGKREESRVSRGTHGEVMVTLGAQTQERIGLKVARLAETNRPPEVRGFARVLDPAPLLALVADLAPAGVAAEAP